MKMFTCLILSILISAGAAFAEEHGYLKAKENEVAIHYSGVEVPLNKILLIRKGTRYCAVKFTRCWTEIDEQRMKEVDAYIARGGFAGDSLKEGAKRKYALYETYYQSDGTGDFVKANVTISQGRASSLPLKGPFRPFIYNPGDCYIKCGPYKLSWQYPKSVAFIPSGKGLGDFGFELSPTPWQDISQVNVFDTRLKWYRYDERRKRIFIPVDNIWEELHRNRENEVLIASDGIRMPIGRILLLRRDSSYCAIRFKKYWTEKNEKEFHAIYQSICPSEGMGDFTKTTLKVTEDGIHFLSPQKYSYPSKRPDNQQIKCGTFKLYWDGEGFVSFYYDGWEYDYPRQKYAIELGPTPWSDISQINVHDNRVKWYKNEERRNIYVPIDKLWEDTK